jgi:hypothetical protein
MLAKFAPEIAPERDTSLVSLEGSLAPRYTSVRGTSALIDLESTFCQRRATQTERSGDAVSCGRLARVLDDVGRVGEGQDERVRLKIGPRSAVML